jgi:predicted DNA-binding protein
MERTNIYLDDRELAALRMLSRQTGRPVAALVREAIDHWLDAQGVEVLTEDEWSRRFASLLGRRSRLAAAEGWTPEGVASDVARAITEVRRSRAARRP